MKLEEDRQINDLNSRKEVMGKWKKKPSWTKPVDASDNYHLKDFLFENLSLEAPNSSYNKELIEGFTPKNTQVNNQEIK